MSSGLKLNEDSVEKKLRNVTNTQDSIQSLSLWILHHKSNHKKIVELWLKVLKKGTENDKKLTLFYLCNDVIQTCRKKHALVYLESFKDVLPESIVAIREANIRPSVERILNIWSERTIYDAEFIRDLLTTLNTKGKSDPKTLADYKPQQVVEHLKSLKLAQTDVDLKVRQMTSAKVDISKSEALSQLKDKAHGRDFAIQFEMSCVKLDDGVVALEGVIKERRILLELVERGREFYEEQFGDARIVANAYKVFGNKLNNLHKKLDELRKSLPDPLSPVPSPNADAPSPGSTPPLIAQSFDDVGAVDMDIDSDDADTFDAATKQGHHDLTDVTHSSKSSHRKPLTESDTNVEALADSSALEKRIANMLPNMPLSLTQSDYGWENSPSLVYNPTPKASAKSEKAEARSSIEDKDNDGSSTPVMDESPTREAPFDMLSRIINKTQHSSASASPTTSFLESLGVVSSPKDKQASGAWNGKNENESTQKSWSSWKAKQAAIAEEEYSIKEIHSEDEPYPSEERYPQSLYESDTRQVIPPMLPPPAIPSSAMTVTSFPLTITNFVPPEQADIWRPPPAIITTSAPLQPSSEGDVPIAKHINPIPPPPIPPLVENWHLRPRGLTPNRNLAPIQTDQWQERNELPSPSTPEPRIPSYLPPRYKQNPKSVPFGPRPPPLMSLTLRGVSPQGMPPSILPPVSTPERGIPLSNTSAALGVPHALVDHSRHWSLDDTPQQGASTLRDIPLVDAPVMEQNMTSPSLGPVATHPGIRLMSAVHGVPPSAPTHATAIRPILPMSHSTSPQRHWSEEGQAPVQYGTPIIRSLSYVDDTAIHDTTGSPRSSPKIEGESYRYRSHSGSDDVNVSSYVPSDPTTSGSYLPPEHAHKPISEGKSVHTLSDNTAASDKKDPAPVSYTAASDSSSVLAEAQLEFIEKLKRKTKSSEETDHASSLEKILLKTKNVMSKLHSKKDAAKSPSREISKSAESNTVATESELPVSPKNKVEISAPSDRKKTKLSSAVTVLPQSAASETSSRRYESAPKRYSSRDDEYERRGNSERDYRRSNSGDYDRYKEAYYDYYYKQVASYHDEQPQKYHARGYHDTRRGGHGWRY